MKFLDSQIDKQKSATKKNWGNSKIIIRYDRFSKTNFSHNLLGTIRKVTGLQKTFLNSSSKDMKLSKTQLSKIIQSGGFFVRLFEPLPKVGLLLMKNVL